MDLKRNVSLSTALQYKGQGPYLTFILHRIGGAGMAVFIAVHILASFTANILGWKVGFYANLVYENWVFQLFIFFCVLFHAINGLRITILDLFPKLIPHYKKAIMIEWIAFLALYGFSFVMIVRAGLGG
jgi:succinate dehydrogenase / fumarate reductase cytochrome b subunit